MGLANQSFTENGFKHHVENAATIQWIPVMPFALSGDSGSIYYACRGRFRYPIAIHRGKVNGQFHSVLGKENYTVSFGTPLREAIMEAGRKFGCQSYPRWKLLIAKGDQHFPVVCDSDCEDDNSATEVDALSGNSSTSLGENKHDEIRDASG